MKWYIMVLKNYAGFTGRARRKEFWWFSLISFMFTIVARILDHVLGLSFSSQPSSSGWIGTLYSLVVLVPSLAVTVRRFHDIGKSGWMYARFCIVMVLACGVYVGYLMYTILKNGDMESLRDGTIDPSVFTGTFFLNTMIFALVMLVLVIWMLVLLFRDSQPGDNRWGPNPKGERIVVDGDMGN